MPAVNGLYACILPGVVYVFLGTSMHMGLAPASLPAILTGQLAIQYGIKSGTQDSVAFAGEAALAVGVICTILSIFNLGDLVHLLSYPVMVNPLLCIS